MKQSPRTSVLSALPQTALFGFGLLLITGTAVLASDAKPAAPADAEADETDLASFDEVWTNVRDSHWDPDLGGVDWEAVRAELRPQAEMAKTRGEIRRLMSQMLNRLGQSHFGIIPAEVYSVVGEDSQDSQRKQGRAGETGLHIRLRGDRMMVVRVDASSSGESLGVLPGWTIVRIGELGAGEMLEAARSLAGRTPMRLETTVALMGTRRTRGTPGDEVEIEFRDRQGAQHSLRIPLRETGYEARFGNLPPVRLAFRQQVLPEKIVYFTFNLFLDPVRVMPAFHGAVDDARNAKGLVIDLRGNHGGIGAMTFGMAAAFAREPGALGTMKTRGHELKFPVFRRADPFEGPVAVLIDECSMSSAEILAGGLKDLGLARLFGNRTAGLALPSKVVELANGDALQCAIANYTSASGKVLEGVGVEPDELVIEAANDFDAREDPVLEQAVNWILAQAVPEDRR